MAGSWNRIAHWWARLTGQADADLDRVFYHKFGAAGSSTLRKLIADLRATYCRTIGVEFMHIRNLEIRDWLLARRTARVRPGQVVLAWQPQRPGFLLVKRVAWREEGGWWLASDNPWAGGIDSVHFGPVPDENIVAVVLGRYWPVGGLRARSREARS